MLNTPATPAPNVNAVPVETTSVARSGANGSVTSGQGWQAQRIGKNTKRGWI